jgi:hypothetical protein
MMLKRTILAAALMMVPLAVFAEGSEDGQGWSFSQRLQGISNSIGVILKTTSTATYSFNQHVKAYSGLPIYFAKEVAPSSNSQFINGFGNIYSGLLITTGDSTPLHYSSDLLFTLPTGDVSRGFSTGHSTVDWTNTFSHSFSRFTPYAVVGIANTLSDTSFFVRPFATKGIASHLETGTLISITPRVAFGASAYAVRAAGQQEIVSQVAQPASQTSTPQQQPSSGNPVSTVVQNPGSGNGAGLVDILGHNGSSNGSSSTPAVFQTEQTTLGPPQIVNDQGFSTSMTLRPSSSTDLQIGYSHSAAYHFDNFFFGIGFHFGHGISVIK